MRPTLVLLRTETAFICFNKLDLCIANLTTRDREEVGREVGRGPELYFSSVANVGTLSLSRKALVIVDDRECR